MGKWWGGNHGRARGGTCEKDEERGVGGQKWEDDEERHPARQASQEKNHQNSKRTHARRTRLPSRAGRIPSANPRGNADPAHGKASSPRIHNGGGHSGTHDRPRMHDAKPASQPTSRMDRMLLGTSATPLPSPGAPNPWATASPCEHGGYPHSPPRSSITLTHPNRGPRLGARGLGRGGEGGGAIKGRGET